MTVGLVIVSHSAQLARGVAELAQQMVQGKVPIIAAGGAGEDILGTSTDIILNALETIDAPDGILILLDMGSALLSTDMALEMLDEERRKHTVISNAPLVEGAINAAVEAAAGSSLAQVKAAADKVAQPEELQKLKPLSSQETPIEVAEEASAPTIEGPHVILTLTNPAGLHARPAALFTQEAKRFKAKLFIQVQGRGKESNAKSLLSLLSLGARQDETIIIRAHGPDAEQALAALQTLVQAGFHESKEHTETAKPTETKTETVPTPLATPVIASPASSAAPTLWKGIPTSPGVALGSAYIYTSQTLQLSSIEHRAIAPEQISAEQARLHEALTATSQELKELAQQMQQQIGSVDAAIFEAQAFMLEDPLLTDSALAIIAAQHIDAASALAEAGEQQAKQLQTLDNAVLAGRAVDIRDVTSRAIRRLRGQQESQADMGQLEQPVILVAHDLTPSDTATLRPDTILGICTTQGGPTAHAAILARALGIPAIAGIDEAVLTQITPGTQLGLDADKGLLYTQMTVEQERDLAERLAIQQQRQARLKSAAKQEQPPLIIGQQQVALLANVGSEVEAEAASQWGAEGVGLLRTEFLFASATTMPGVEEQRQRYARLFRAFYGQGNTKRPITVRTLDAGADKPMAAMQEFTGVLKEANPALGLRGIRIHLVHQQLLEQQLTALLLAAADTNSNLHIMFPMITTVEELVLAREIFARVYNDLKQQQVVLPAQVPLGIMVEVPAAALMAVELAELADFFSIGANDLSQYTLAADRTNADVAPIYNPMQPAVLRLIQHIAQAGQRAGKPVAVCGEMASDPRLAPLLVGVGVSELSMVPTALPVVREALTKKTGEELETLVGRVMTAKTLDEVATILS